MQTDTKQFLIAMATLDRVIGKFESTTYQSSYESQITKELENVRTLLTSACVPGEYKPESELDLHQD